MSFAVAASRIQPQVLLRWSVAVAVVTIALKGLAWWVSGSVGLLSDAMESLVNLASALFALLMVKIALRPADEDHPYGHHKAEYLSAVLEGVLIVLAALSILREAYLSFLAPRALDAPLQGLLVNGLATAINAAWCFALSRYGRRHRSPALVADGQHLLTDVITSVGVIVGVGVAAATRWTILDPLVAALVALNIVWMGYRLMKESVGGLMDAAAPPDVQERIRAVISKQADGALEAHDLRTRHAGRVTFIDFHLVVAAGMTVMQAHDICDRIEHALRDEMGEAVVTIHVEPENKAKHSGVLVL